MKLKPATNKIGFAKVGIYGDAGAGKTWTAALIAIGLHQYFKCEKPVGMFDTEPGASFIKPLFEEAGIELLVYDESRALSDVMDFMDELEKSCSVGIVDSVTHIWRDSMESFLKSQNERRRQRNQRPIYQLEFHHWNQIKPAWHRFTDRYLSCPLHMIVCGRAGSVYSYQKSEETGRMEVIQEGTRMATEKELGYEPSLLIEMTKKRVEIGKNKIVNTALVEKDRTGKLNGQEIENPNFDSFMDHWKVYNKTGDHAAINSERDSQGMYEESAESSGWDAEKRNRTIWAEEIKALFVVHELDGQSASAKKARGELLEKFFGTGSWTKISEDTPADILQGKFGEIKDHLEPPDPSLDEDTPF